MVKYGIDVSEWQGDIDWSAVTADFAIIRAGYGKELSQEDERFEQNYAGAKAAGIPVGAYWYSYATNVEEAVKEAEVCLKVIAGKRFEYPIYLDIEEQRTLSLGKAAVTAIIKAFLDKVESAGYWVGLYMSASPLSAYVSESVRNRYAVWVAHYGVSKPGYSGSYGMWQKSSTGSVPGISGNADLDECYVDYPKLIKESGCNGYAPEPPTKTVRLTIDGTTWEGELHKI